MNTIGDMQNEKYFYGYYNMFEYNHDFWIQTSGIRMSQSLFLSIIRLQWLGMIRLTVFILYRLFVRFFLIFFIYSHLYDSKDDYKLCSTNNTF